MGADATLVNMAYKAAAAKKPGDWSSSFNTQYEGLIAAHRKQAGIITKGFKGIVEIGKSIKKRQEKSWEDIEDLDIGDIYDVGKAIDNLGREKASGDIKNMGTHYDGGGVSNIGEQDSAEAEMLEIKNGTEDGNYKDGLEYYANKTFLSKEDKKNQSNLLKRAQKFKDKLIKSKGLKRTIVGAYAANDVDLKRTFGGDGEKAMALKQILDPDADWEKIGIRSAWEDGEKYYYYTPGRLKTEYQANQVGFKLEFKESEIRVSEKELFGGVVMKDKQTEAANKEIIINMKESVKTHNTFSGEDKEGNKIGAFSLEETTRDGFKQNFMNADGGSRNAVIDFASRGLYGRSYSDDLKEGISILTYEQLLGRAGMSTLDTNNDGEISDAEALTGKINKDVIENMHRILTSPKDDAEAKFAIEEASNYLTDLARQEFNKQKGMSDEADNIPEWKQQGFSDYGKWKTYWDARAKEKSEGYITLPKGKESSIFAGGKDTYIDEIEWNNLNKAGEKMHAKGTFILNEGTKDEREVAWNEDKQTYMSGNQIVPNKRALFDLIYKDKGTSGEVFAPGYLKSDSYKSIKDWKGGSDEGYGLEIIKDTKKKYKGVGPRLEKQGVKPSNILSALQSFSGIDLKTVSDLDVLAGKVGRDSDFKQKLIDHLNKEMVSNISANYLVEMINDLAGNTKKKLK